MSQPAPKPPPSQLPVELIYGRPAKTVTLSAADIIAILDAKRGAA